MNRITALACSCVVLLSRAAAAQPFPEPTYPSMQAYQHVLAKSCPDKKLGSRPPAELLDDEDNFRGHLAPPDRAKLDEALPRASDGGIAACSNQNGAACDQKAYLDAFLKLHLIHRFAALVCKAH